MRPSWAASWRMASLPVASPEFAIRFFEATGEEASVEATDVGHPLPIHLMGRLGWQRFAEQVTDVWEALPAHQRDRAVVLAPHWLWAAATMSQLG